VDELLALAKRWKLGSISDEMHRLANPNAKVTKAAHKLTQHTEWRLGLTGTPLRSNIHDIWAQWYLIDLGVTFGANFVQFRREFMVENVYSPHEIKAREGALEEVGLRMRRRGLRFTKQDCLDLPPKVYEKIEVDLTPEQKKAYKQMENTLIARLQDQPIGEESDGEERVATAANQLVMLLRLTQITSGFVTDDDGNVYVFPTNPKLAALEEIVRETIDDQKQIVWAVYRNDIDAIVRKLADLHPRVIDGRQVGSKGQRERDEIETAFARGEFPLIVANPAAGGVGLNLQPASMAHYFSQSYSLIQRLQSEDRCHRSGSERHNKVTYNDFIARGTIDEVVSAAIAEKKDIADVVVDLRRHIGLEN
jgi:SNF2 family DNA or RNA helicase